MELLADEVRAEGAGLFLHPRVDHAGVDAGDGDVVGLPFEGEDAGELVEGGLGGAVGGHAGHRVAGGGAGDVDDAAPATRNHVRQRLPDAEKGAGRIHVEDAAPVGGFRSRDRERDAGRAGVVYQDVYGSEPGPGPLEGLGDGFLCGDVQGHREGAAAARLDLARHGSHFPLRPGSDGHGGPLPGEEAGRRRADAAPAAGDQGHPARVWSAFHA